MRSKISMFGILLVVVALCAIAFAGANKSKTAEPPIDAKSGSYSPSFRPHPGGLLDDTLVTQGFESGQMPPPNWTRIVLNAGDPTYTWHIANFQPFEGVNNAQVLYDPALNQQDEWLISPVINLTTGGLNWSVHFAWNSSYYWGVSPYNNYDLELRISTNGGSTWLPEVLWVEDNVGVFDNYAWYEADVPLSAYLAQSNVKIAFRYVGVDGAQAGVDAISVESAGPVGTVMGTVTSDVDPFGPVVGATVEVMGTGLMATTNASGDYDLTGVPVGTHTLEFTHPSYSSVTVPNVVVAENDTTVVDAQMHPLNLVFHDYASTAPPSPIADLDTAYMNLDVTDDVVIADLDVTINITHTYDSDLTIWLDTPWNQRILLAMEVGGSGNNFVNTRFDDEAATPIGNGAPPFTGSFQPQEALAAADGMPVTGQWTLVVYDGYGADTGTINNFTLHVASEATAADDPHENIPSLFAFRGNYPNPFNATTQFRFDMGRAGHASLILYNVVGQEVARLVDGSVEAGAHSVALDASGLTSGLYLARFTAPGFSETRKVVLLK